MKARRRTRAKIGIRLREKENFRESVQGTRDNSRTEKARTTGLGLLCSPRSRQTAYQISTRSEKIQKGSGLHKESQLEHTEKKIGRRGATIKGISRELRQLEGRGWRQQNCLVKRKPVPKFHAVSSTFGYQAGEKKTGADKGRALVKSRDRKGVENVQIASWR